MNKQVVLTRLLAKCRVTKSGCWEWTGFRSMLGYGQVYAGGRSWAVHRLMFILENGPIERGAKILHSCDNPPCFNPAHLSAGDQRQNVVESVRRGRHHKVKLTHCKRGHKFTPANTYVSPDGWRHCKTCYRAKERIRLGWPADLAYSVPKKQGWPPKGMVRVQPKSKARSETHCKNGHELTAANIYVTPKGYRQCRKCRTRSVYRFAEKLGSQSDGRAES